MRLLVSLLAAALLAGCSQAAGCFVGVSVIPPSPVFVCGFDSMPAEEDDLDV